MSEHLGYIQNIISRMANNSFLIKGWTITLISLLFILAVSGKPNIWFLILSLLPIICFWGLDSYYLRQERLFRELYNDVRLGEIKTPFTMDTRPYGKRIGYWLVFFSKTIAPLYITIILLNIALLLLITNRIIL